jgi:SAM-dependent methyltransferase
MMTIIDAPGRAREDARMEDTAPATWDSPAMVDGFVKAPANQRLLHYAGALPRDRPLQVVDIGCGAGRNAVPLARAGCVVSGTDLSRPMLQAASARPAAGRLHLAQAAMDALPIAGGSAELIIAHGIWNLARTGAEFRRAIREAARIAAPRARLFVFTFARHTLPVDERPVEGETFVFTRFSGEPQVFLTADQLIDELHAAGFQPDPALPLRVLNLPPQGLRRLGGPPIILEGGFTYTGS